MQLCIHKHRFSLIAATRLRAIHRAATHLEFLHVGLQFLNAVRYFFGAVAVRREVDVRFPDVAAALQAQLAPAARQSCVQLSARWASFRHMHLSRTDSEVD